MNEGRGNVSFGITRPNSGWYLLTNAGQMVLEKVQVHQPFVVFSQAKD